MPARRKQAQEPEPDLTVATVETAPESTTETPAPEAVTVVPTIVPESIEAPDIIAAQENWNPKSETREISVPLTREEVSAAANDLADTVTKIRELEEEKKASADHYKALIGEEEKKQNAITDLIKRNTAPKQIPCQWFFEISGRDDEGRFIRDPNYKTLIRLDTQETVEIKPITQEERQMALPFEEVPAPAGFDQVPTNGTVETSDHTEEPESEPDPEDPTITAAREAGKTANDDGKHLENNPYEEGSDEFAAWDAGWMDADASKPL